jgi:hypothetical protein
LRSRQLSVSDGDARRAPGEGAVRRWRRLAAVSVWLLISTVPGPARAWGEAGHRIVNRAAAGSLPASMPKFLREATERLAYLGPEPDRWRRNSEPTLKRGQMPEHYLYLDLLPGDFSFPRDRYAFQNQVLALDSPGGEDRLLPERVGFLPYATIEIFERLKVAFRAYRQMQREGHTTDLVEGNIVFYAGLLGHYVADGAQPLHLTRHRNGWLGANPRGYAGPGIHARFEREFVERNVGSADLAGRVGPPLDLEDPFADTLAFLRRSAALVERVYRIDEADGCDGAGSPEALEFTRERLAAGSQMLVSLWLEAWRESD